jgi:hypothetical protein
MVGISYYNSFSDSSLPEPEPSRRLFLALVFIIGFVFVFKSKAIFRQVSERFLRRRDYFQENSEMDSIV